MAFEIIATTNGPLVSYNGKMIAINDNQDMIDVAEANPTVIDAMFDSISTELSSSVTVYMDGISNGMNPNPARIFAYVNAAQQFSAWRNHHWRQYQTALQQAQAEATPSEG